MGKYIKKYDSIEVESDVELVTMHTKKTENNIDIHEISFKWDRGAINNKSYVSITLQLPLRRAWFRWAPFCQLDTDATLRRKLAGKSDFTATEILVPAIILEMPPTK